jgi:hypothetical protein
MKKRSLGYFSLILIGPLVVVLYLLISDTDMTLSGFLQFICIAYGLGFMTLIISSPFYFFIKNFRKSLKFSIIASEILYLCILLIYIIFFDEKNKSENIMWLPGLVLFLIILSLPMAFSISYGAGKIIRSHFKI